MNKDQVAGSMKDTAGKVQKNVGDVVGSDQQQVKGVEKQAEGKTQKTVGNVKDTLGK